MSESQSSLRRRREYPPKGPEDKILREIASSLLMLDISTLRALAEHGDPNDYRIFQQLTKDHISSISRDGFSRPIHLFETAVRRYVRTLSGEKLDQVVSKPVDSQFYREMIYLRINDCENMREEAMQMGGNYNGFEAAEYEFKYIVKLSRNLYEHIKDASMNGYLEKHIVLLKTKVQSIDEVIEDACRSLRIPHQPLVYTDTANQR